MAELSEQEVGEILTVLRKVAAGNPGFSVTAPKNGSSASAALVQGINAVLEAWRQSELKARAVKKQLEAKLGTIETQAAAIRELSTPVLEIWEDTLVLPIVGVLDARRSSDMMESLLEGIMTHNARHAILDVTGVELMDTKTADHLLQAVRAARLLGTECVLTGLSTQSAQTLAEMGTDLSEVQTMRRLRDGLRSCIETNRSTDVLATPLGRQMPATK